MEKICPMMSRPIITHNSYSKDRIESMGSVANKDGEVLSGIVYCQGDKCAWNTYGRCAIYSIAGSQDRILQVTAGEV